MRIYLGMFFIMCFVNLKGQDKIDIQKIKKIDSSVYEVILGYEEALDIKLIRNKICYIIREYPCDKLTRIIFIYEPCCEDKHGNNLLDTITHKAPSKLRTVNNTVCSYIIADYYHNKRSFIYYIGKSSRKNKVKCPCRCGNAN